MSIQELKATEVLRTFGRKPLPGGSNFGYYTSYQDAATSVVIREKLLWVMAQKLSVAMDNSLLSFEDIKCPTMEELDDFADSFDERYVWGDCIYQDILSETFFPFGDYSWHCIYLPELDEYSVYHPESLSDISDSDLMQRVCGDENVAVALPKLVDVCRATLDYDPDRQQSDPKILIMKSRRIGRYLSSGIKDDEVKKLIKILAEPMISNYYSYSGLCDGIWYAGTIMGMIDPYETISFDSLNPRFMPAALLLDGLMRRHESKRIKGRRTRDVKRYPGKCRQVGRCRKRR